MELKKAHRISSINDSSNRSPSDWENGESDDEPRGSSHQEHYRSLSAEEAVNFGGLLSSALSLNTKNLFSAFVAEMEPLRAEVARLKNRKNFYKEMSVNHAFLPLPNRRQFLRQIESHLSQRQGLQPRPITLLIHIGSVANFRKHFGRRAADLFLKHTTKVLLSAVQPSDIVGSFGGEDFGVIFFPINPKQNFTRLNEIHMDLKRNPFVWQGVDYPLDAVLGWQELIDNLTLEEAFEAADQRIRKKLGNYIGV